MIRLRHSSEQASWGLQAPAIGLPAPRVGALGRCLLLVAIWTLVAAPHLSVAAQTGTPVPTLVVAKRLDLAALTLRPSDLEAVGLSGFGMANQSALRDAETDAFLQAGGDPDETADRLATYVETSFQYRYVGSMLRPRVPLERLPSGLVAAEQRISTAVSRYATAQGAATGYAFTEGALDDPRGRDVPGTRTFGDESELTRSRGNDPETGDRLRRLELSFRVGNLVAEVTIVDYADNEPEVATVEQLAELLLARIERGVMLGPGLSPRALRITPLAPWIEEGRLRDFYVRIDRVEEPTFSQIVTAIREGRETPAPSLAPPGTVLPQDTYMFWTPVGEGDPLELPLYVSWIDRYESEQQASASLRAVTTDLGPGYTNVRELAQIAEPVGEDSRTFAYHFEGDPTATVRGYVVVARIGEVIVRVQADGPDGVQRRGVTAVAQRQVACEQALQICAPLPMAEVVAWLQPEPPASAAEP